MTEPWAFLKMVAPTTTTTSSDLKFSCRGVNMW